MPAFPHGEDVVSIRMKHVVKVLESPCSFETFWQCPNPSLMGNDGAMLDLTNELNTGLSDKWADMADSTATWAQTTGVFYCGSSQHDVTSTDDPLPGALTLLLNPNTDSLPASIALVLQKRTGLAGRNNRGRIFLPGVSEACNDRGFLQDPASRTAANAICEYLGTIITVAGFDMAARHWDRKGSRLEVITDWRYFDEFRTRKDRQRYRLGVAH